MCVYVCVSIYINMCTNISATVCRVHDTCFPEWSKFRKCNDTFSFSCPLQPIDAKTFFSDAYTREPRQFNPKITSNNSIPAMREFFFFIVLSFPLFFPPCGEERAWFWINDKTYARRDEKNRCCRTTSCFVSRLKYINYSTARCLEIDLESPFRGYFGISDNISIFYL